MAKSKVFFYAHACIRVKYRRTGFSDVIELSKIRAAIL